MTTVKARIRTEPGVVAPGGIGKTGHGHHLPQMNDDKTRTPALFIGHGSPTNALEDNSYTRGWREIGQSIGKPRAIVAISAHWYFGATAITAMERPRTIHDFYGFGQELFDVEYPAPGSPDIAEEIVEAVKPEWVGLDRDQWGIDHGTWSVLLHMFPDADIPVLQLSINALRPLDYHIALARRLAPLRRKGVAFIASGNVVHNLRRVDWNNADGGYDWAQRFDDAAAQQMLDAPGDVLKIGDHPDYANAVPTPDHFIPLLYLAGLAEADDEKPEIMLRGNTLGSISMTSYGLGLDMAAIQAAGGGGDIPRAVPPDQTNI